MRRNIEPLKSKEPHQRRQHALRMAGVATAMVFLIWISTLGVRIASQSPVAEAPNGFEAAVAGYEDAVSAQNSLMVAPTGQ